MRESDELKRVCDATEWWPKLLTSIFLAFDDGTVSVEDLECINFTMDPRFENFEVAIVTPKLVLVGRVSNRKNKHEIPTLEVGHRSDVRAVTIENKSGFFENTGFDPWPYVSTVTLHHSFLGQIVLNAEKLNGQVAQTELEHVFRGQVASLE